MSSVPANVAPRRGPLEAALGVFAEVHPGEATTALLMMINVFLLLTSYYIIKPVREALILSGEGAEAKSYASAAMILVLLLYVPAYGALANRVGRVRLITWVTLFFAGCLVAFYAMAQARVPHLGLAFFVWVGIFNVSIVAQFWSYANDIYTPDEGKRLFAIIAFGSTLGAILGAGVARALIGPFGVRELLLVAAALLIFCILLTRAVERREQARLAAHGRRIEDAPPPDTGGGFRLIFRDRYLLAIAFLLLILNFVNSNGEYILGKTLSLLAERTAMARHLAGADAAEFKQRLIGGFYATFYTWVNGITAVIQLFLVARIFKWFGVRVALYVLPVIALGGYAILALAPVLGLVRGVKIAENATDYSLQNTARQALFLPTSREAKYKAKAAIDTFFYRAGDLFSAGLVFLGTQVRLTPQKFAGINVVLVLVWLGITVLIGREHRRLTGERGRLT